MLVLDKLSVVVPVMIVDVVCRPAPTLQFAPGIKAGLAKNGTFLPDEIFRHM